MALDSLRIVGERIPKPFGFSDQKSLIDWRR